MCSVMGYNTIGFLTLRHMHKDNSGGSLKWFLKLKLQEHNLLGHTELKEERLTSIKFLGGRVSIWNIMFQIDYMEHIPNVHNGIYI